MEYFNITNDLSCLDFETPPESPTGYLVYSTKAFRGLARKVLPDTIVIEIGSSYGVATELLSKRTKYLCGIETSSECVKTAKVRYPDIRFEMFDVMGRYVIELQPYRASLSSSFRLPRRYFISNTFHTVRVWRSSYIRNWFSNTKLTRETTQPFLT